MQNTLFSYESTKLPINQILNYFFAGGGLNMVYASTDAIFEPLAAQQVLNSRRWDIQTAKNDALLQTGAGRTSTCTARGARTPGALDAVARGRKLVARVERLSEDLVPQAEVDRAKRSLANLEQQAAMAREDWRVASADLTQVLRLDPRAVVDPLEPDHLQVTLIDPAQPLDELIPVGLTNRPELSSQQALVQETLVRIRQEKYRPLLPTVLFTGFGAPGGMTTQVGIFGLGSDSSMNHWSERNDFSVQLQWQFEGLGFGNLARIKTQRGRQSQEVAELYRIQDSVAGDVVRSASESPVGRRSGAPSSSVGPGGRSPRSRRTTKGCGQTTLFETVLVQVYRPQEAVEALEQLKAAYDAYFGTVADYNRAQFELYHALGYPAQDLSINQPPGTPSPVDAEPPRIPAAG